MISFNGYRSWPQFRALAGLPVACNLPRPPAQRQLPPSQLAAQLAPSAHRVEQLPPSQLRLQVDPDAHPAEQLLPSHERLHTAPAWQSSEQLPPSHAMLQVEPPMHTNAQFPWSQVKAQVLPPGQVCASPAVSAGGPSSASGGGGPAGSGGGGEVVATHAAMKVNASRPASLFMGSSARDDTKALTPEPVRWASIGLLVGREQVTALPPITILIEPPRAQTLSGARASGAGPTWCQ